MFVVCIPNVESKHSPGFLTAPVGRGHLLPSASTVLHGELRAVQHLAASRSLGGVAWRQRIQSPRGPRRVFFPDSPKKWHHWYPTCNHIIDHIIDHDHYIYIYHNSRFSRWVPQHITREVIRSHWGCGPLLAGWCCGPHLRGAYWHTTYLPS